MKKLFTGALALVLAVSMCVPVFAGTTDGKIPVAGDVQGKYVAGAEAPETIVVDVTWDDMTFTYREEAKEWNPDTHEYDQPDGKWDSTPQYITVTNHSNINVLATIACKWNNGITGGFDLKDSSEESSNALTLSSPKNDGIGQWKQPIFVTGGKLAENGNIGTITITISTFE